MRKFTVIAVLISILAAISLTACPPGGDDEATKRGGGGKQQPYNPNDGRYK
jgi:hypothetical protein